MKKKYPYSASRYYLASGASVWRVSIAPFLLLLFVTGVSSTDAAALCSRDNLWCHILRGINDAHDSGSTSPINAQVWRNAQVCNGFRCRSSECLDFEQVCDNVPNCADGSDENPAACTNRTCELSLDFDDLKQLGSGLVRLDSVVKAWRCNNGECIGDVYRCDGKRNCGDASDETENACFDRSCTPAQFTCNTGQCIVKANLCDGKNDCYDGSDEDTTMCRVYLRSRPSIICPARVLNYCADRTQCYHKRQQCDGVANCFDGSDEDPETCGVTGAPAPINTPPTTPAPAVTPPAPPTPTPSAPEDTEPDGSNVEFPDAATNSANRCDPPACPCPVPGMEHVCLPCHEFDNVSDTCILLQSGTPVCSVELQHSSIRADILSCGGQGLQPDLSHFERNFQGCASVNNMVPVMTVVMADCWSAATVTLRCHSDGTWGEYGVMTSSTERMHHICQPRHINSNLCGRKPRYKSTKNDKLNLNDFYALRNLHPWLVGLKRWERYECSATLITNAWLVTAAHCVVRTQASYNETIDPRDLKVQLTSQRRSDKYVSEILIHPLYQPGRRPLNDIALIRLEHPMSFGSHRYPACVDLSGEGFVTSPFAMTFSRPNGMTSYVYATVLQQVDPECHSPVSRCRSLRIKDSQFCGIDLEKRSHLPGGSSGGPFMQNLASDQDERWAVSGIVSYEVEKRDCGLPFTIYTSVHFYQDWVDNAVNNGPLF